MRKEKVILWETGEYSREHAGGYVPFFMAKLHEGGQPRPAMVVLPGGGFVLLSPSEAEYIANRFYDLGYNAFVLSYTNNITFDAPVGDQLLKDLARAVKLIRKNSGAYGVDSSRVYACGSSAGGYVVGSLAQRHADPLLSPDDAYRGISCRLDGAVMVYPLVSDLHATAFFTDPFKTLLGESAPEEEREKARLERHVHPGTSPMFLLHGCNDVANAAADTMALAAAALDAGIDCELHLMGNTGHGFAGNDASRQEIADSVYVFDQLFEFVKAADWETLRKYGGILGSLNPDMDYDAFMRVVLAETLPRYYTVLFDGNFESIVDDQMHRRNEIPAWPLLADEWIRDMEARGGRGREK